MTPVQVEVLFPLVTSLEFSCTKCALLINQLDAHKNYHSSCKDEFPEDMKQDMDKLASCIRKITDLYNHRVQIRLIDAQSPLGLWKQIRHRVSGMPAFIVDRQGTCTGWDTDRLEELIDARMIPTSQA